MSEPEERWEKRHFSTEEYPWAIERVGLNTFMAHCYHEWQVDRLIEMRAKAALADEMAEAIRIFNKAFGEEDVGSKSNDWLARYDALDQQT